jgi:hypothetical protein
MNYMKQKVTEEKSKANEEDWCKKIWEVLEGESRGGVHPETLKAFTAAIMKIMIASEVDNANTRYGSFYEKGEYMLSQKQANAIHKDFNVLYLNKNAYNTPSTKALEEAECTFKPHLSGSSVMNPGRVVPKQKVAQHIEQMMQFKEQQEAYDHIIIQ